MAGGIFTFSAIDETFVTHVAAGRIYRFFATESGRCARGKTSRLFAIDATGGCRTIRFFASEATEGCRIPRSFATDATDAIEGRTSRVSFRQGQRVHPG